MGALQECEPEYKDVSIPRLPFSYVYFSSRDFFGRSEVPEERKTKESIDVEVYNKSNYILSVLFTSFDFPYLKPSYEYILSPKSEGLVTIPSGSDIICLQFIKDSGSGKRNVLETNCSFLDPEEKIHKLFVVSSGTCIYEFNKTSLPWIICVRYVCRKKLSLVNNSTKTVSIINEDTSQLVPPNTFMKFKSFTDVATHRGSQLDIKRAILIDNSTAYKVYSPIPSNPRFTLVKEYCVDGLLFECEDDLDNSSVSVTVKDEAGG